jgi:hypothetical protein
MPGNGHRKATATDLLKPRGHLFKVTPKGGVRDRLLVQWRRIAGFGLLLGLSPGRLLVTGEESAANSV